MAVFWIKNDFPFNINKGEEMDVDQALEQILADQLSGEADTKGPDEIACVVSLNDHHGCLYRLVAGVNPGAMPGGARGEKGQVIASHESPVREKCWGHYDLRW